MRMAATQPRDGGVGNMIVYLEFRSSSTSIVTMPNKLMYVCISGRFESMQSILEVSH